MTKYTSPRSLRLVGTAVAFAAVVGSVGLCATSASADSAGQPALTAQDHALTDVPGLVNARELGAYAGLNGQIANAPRLIRSESLDKLTQDGAATLANKYHVDLVIDLRTASQIQAKPDVPIPGAQVVNISMFGTDGNYPDDTVMYHDLVDKGYVDASNRGPMVSAYAQILQLLAQHATGTVLIHCSHGMDRTGTVIDLLDHILGIDESDMLHDYLLSNTQLNVTWATPQLLQGTFETDIANKYHGMDAYIANTIGVSPQEASALRARFLVSNDAAASSLTIGGVSVPLDAASTQDGAKVVVPLATTTDSDVAVGTESDAATASVTIADRLVTVTVTAQDGTTTKRYRIVEGRPPVALAQGAAVTEGSTVSLSGTGLTPGAVYQIVVHSTPRVIGSVTAGADGSVAASVVIPSDLATGTHTLFLADQTGAAVSDSLTISVAAPAAVGPSVATGGTLAAAAPVWPWMGLGVLGAGILALLGVRRYRIRRVSGR